jgi:hypothetical protein
METNINEDIIAYESLKENLEADHMGEWALVHNRELVSLFQTFEKAAEAAVEQFGRGPYLIRQIGAQPVVLPASIMYPMPVLPVGISVHGQYKVRL